MIDRADRIDTWQCADLIDHAAVVRKRSRESAITRT
jgi:hypothetical protein